ncbi:MAG TPA: alpha/beta hydrolase [Acidimicrobiales bacterium]|nr:alpha/beta hydrolase [Acidimicrobiales bacterium]
MPTQPPLLLLAGMAQSGRYWDRFRPWLDGFHLITPDNRETGEAGPCPEGFTIEDLAADALAAVDRELGGAFTVVGHSMGGMIAQALAFEVPERIERLVLVSTRPGRSHEVPIDPSVLAPPAGLTLPDDPADAPRAIRAAYYEKYMAPGEASRKIAREEAERAHGNSAELEGLMRQIMAMSVWEPGAELRGLDTDIAVVHGDLDSLVPYGNGEIVARLAGVPLVTLHGVGHMVPWEAPDELAEVIRGLQ